MDVVITSTPELVVEENLHGNAKNMSARRLIRPFVEVINEAVVAAGVNLGRTSMGCRGSAVAGGSCS